MEKSLSQLTLRDLMDAGFHFGHQTKRWNPKMKKYIYDKRNGIHIIDITQSLDLLEEALAFVQKIAENGKKVLFVGTKKQAQEVVKAAATESDSFYMTNRWLGGTLTNAQTIRKSIRRMRQLEQLERDNNGVLSPHKKEASVLRRELEKLQQNLTGVAKMESLPAALFVVDICREKNAVAEANRLGIPVIAIVDTNADPDLVTYAIPGNDDSIRSIKLISDSIAKVLKDGTESYARKAAEAHRKQEEDRAAKRAAAAAIAAEKGDVPAATDRPARRTRRPRVERAAGEGKGADAKTRQTEIRRKSAEAAAAAIKARAAAAQAKTEA